ncbi:hypothetical protein DB346_00135 [Verrucomicrobia bacterium LW23]|nr:hypothetical protein DB346_00135 [Verrucomicrobia bacterium LW23]
MDDMSHSSSSDSDSTRKRAARGAKAKGSQASGLPGPESPDAGAQSAPAPVSAPRYNLTGEWIGHYKGHFDEVIRIQQDGDKVVAIKITGDDYVPADEITWKACLTTGEGEGQIAEEEFRNPRFVPGQLKVLSAERIVFTWAEYGAVEYRRDD